ncbi:MAG TPA: RNA polymerase sigma factor, partial [Solirubrobacteraceae bacterium]
MEPRLLSHPARLAGTSLLRLQSDERLVDLARAGHEQAFATIVNRHGPALQRYCARLLGPERAEDAVQQAFINAHNAMTRHDDTRELQIRPWLYRIAHNVSLNVLRSRHDDAELTDAIPSAERVEDTVIGRDQLARTLAAVAALPMHQRDALVLRELEGRSHDEIATTLGVSPGAARQHVFRARAAMRTGVTAITPNVLMIRLLESGAGAASGGVPEIAAGAGLGLGAVGTKIAVGLLAAGAIVGGAVGTGVVPMPHILRHHHARSHESAAA